MERREAVSGVKRILRNATVIDGTGAPPLHDAVIVIEDDRITEVTTGRSILGASAEVVDLNGRACLPGLIDLHVHLCWDGSPDPVEVNAREGHDLTLLRMVHHARATLERGVTTVRDVGCIDDLSLVLDRALR